MRTSFFLGTGIASSSSRRTSGGPYRVQTTALNCESPQPTNLCFAFAPNNVSAARVSRNDGLGPLDKKSRAHYPSLPLLAPPPTARRPKNGTHPGLSIHRLYSREPEDGVVSAARGEWAERRPPSRSRVEEPIGG